MDSKPLYKKVVVTASDFDAVNAAHLRADCYGFKQALKLGIAMCLTSDAARKHEVARKDALGQPITVTIAEALIDEQGHTCDADGKVLVENPEAHNFTLQTRGYARYVSGAKLADAQVFAPVKNAEGKWELKPTSSEAIAKTAAASAAELEARAKALRAKVDAVEGKTAAAKK